MIIAKIKTMSTTEPSQIHTITVEKNPDRVYCTCTGCMVHGYCKHIRFYKRTIGKLLGKNGGKSE